MLHYRSQLISTYFIIGQEIQLTKTGKSKHCPGFIAFYLITLFLMILVHLTYLKAFFIHRKSRYRILNQNIGTPPYSVI